jgi:hypothetical protein
MDTLPTSSYLSMRVDVPIRTAAAALVSLLSTPTAPLVVDGVRFVASPRDILTVALPRHAPYIAVLTAPGTLVAFGVRQRVDLELLPWSGRASELGLRPLGRRGRPSELFYDRGLELLMYLRRCIHDWADEPLRAMSAPMATPAELARCYLLIQTDPGTTADVLRRTRELSAVADATATTGSYDVFVQAAGDTIGIRQLPEQLRTLPGVARVLICLPKS